MLLSNELLPNTDQVQSQCSHLPGDFGALPICWQILEHASICWQALWRCWFPFPAGLYHLPTLPKPLPSDLLTMILLCLIGQLTCLTWTPYNSLHSYSTFLSTQSILHCEGGSPQPPPMCSIHLDDATATIMHQNAHHTPAYWWRGDKVFLSLFNRDNTLGIVTHRQPMPCT